jgi:hypothetical protein
MNSEGRLIMRKLISLQTLLDQAREDNMDPRDLAVDEDTIYDVAELEDDSEEGSEDDEE